MTAITKRHEFVYLFDVSNGNPNGDPDAGNLPRLDPETNKGLVTDVCLKRKIRNFVSLAHEGANGHAIYMQEKGILNEQHLLGRQAVGLKDETKEELKKLPKDAKKAAEITAWMCANFFDVRTFGAVMSTGVNAGQVRGPVQLGFATSIDPVLPMEVSITRMAVTNADDAEKERTMGRKNIIPYGLYRAHGFVSAKLAERTGFNPDDLQTLWQALINMFEHDRSAARGEMAARKLVVFEHDSAMGNAPAHQLFELVQVSRKGSEADGPARSFADYEVRVNAAQLPSGVNVHELL